GDPHRHPGPVADEGEERGDDNAHGDEQGELGLDGGDLVKRSVGVHAPPSNAYPTPWTVRIRSAPTLARTDLMWLSRVRLPRSSCQPHTSRSRSSRRRTTPGWLMSASRRSNSVGVRWTGSPSTVTVR